MRPAEVVTLLNSLEARRDGAYELITKASTTYGLAKMAFEAERTKQVAKMGDPEILLWVNQ